MGKYRILKGTYTRRNKKTKAVERFKQGDDVEFSDKQAKRYGLYRLQKIEDVKAGKVLVTNPAKKDEDEGDQNPPSVSAAAQKLIDEYELDVSEITGTGKDGAITKPDVEAFLNGEGNE